MKKIIYAFLDFKFGNNISVIKENIDKGAKCTAFYVIAGSKVTMNVYHYHEAKLNVIMNIYHYHHTDVKGYSVPCALTKELTNWFGIESTYKLEKFVLNWCKDKVNVEFS